MRADSTAPLSAYRIVSAVLHSPLEIAIDCRVEVLYVVIREREVRERRIETEIHLHWVMARIKDKLM